MSRALTLPPLARALIDRLDEEVDKDCPVGVCDGVQEALVSCVARGADLVPEDLLRPAPDCYARRLLHRDPKGRYTIVVMVWDRGQGTPLHDHNGLWCVECVYRGRIRIVNYDLKGRDADGRYRFRPEKELFAGVGEAGHLIPPLEYHVIENAHPEGPAVTVHVYGGEMERCNTFAESGDGRWVREERTLTYTP
jgi:predicted metal-dependent enzyme (double-stranded beta helix superfamily)